MAGIEVPFPDPRKRIESNAGARVALMLVVRLREYALTALFYESVAPVKSRRPSRARHVPFFYPSIGIRLAHPGCFEVVLAAPSTNEP
jgi:hypothetical protein